MIKITAHRNNGVDQPPHIRQVTIGKAVATMLQFELGYGGKIVSASQDHVSIRTVVMACVDDTHFSGPREEVGLLLKAADLYYQLAANDALRKTGIENLIKITGGSPLLITRGAGVFMGAPLACAAAALMISEEEADFSKLMSLKEADLFALLALKLDCQCSADEAMQLV